MPKSSSLRQNRFTELAVSFRRAQNRFANELRRRNYVTGEMWKNKPPFCVTLNMASFYESGAALGPDMGVPVLKMEESIEARYQAP